MKPIQHDMNGSKSFLSFVDKDDNAVIKPEYFGFDSILYERIQDSINEILGLEFLLNFKQVQYHLPAIKKEIRQSQSISSRKKVTSKKEVMYTEETVTHRKTMVDFMGDKIEVMEPEVITSYKTVDGSNFQLDSESSTKVINIPAKRLKAGKDNYIKARLEVFYGRSPWPCSITEGRKFSLPSDLPLISNDGENKPIHYLGLQFEDVSEIYLKGKQFHEAIGFFVHRLSHMLGISRQDVFNIVYVENDYRATAEKLKNVYKGIEPVFSAWIKAIEKARSESILTFENAEDILNLCNQFGYGHAIEKVKSIFRKNGKIQMYYNGKEKTYSEVYDCFVSCFQELRDKTIFKLQ